MCQNWCLYHKVDDLEVVDLRCRILENAMRTQMLLQEETVKGGEAHHAAQGRDDEVN